jgi:hypothetical protein
VSSEAEDVRGLRPQAANSRAGVGGEQAVVRGVRRGGGGGGASVEAEDVRGLRPQGAKTQADIGEIQDELAGNTQT